ncbi:hypothetical protein EMPS_02451 [Entomortierella parvispora]|uniref:RRM domain-containing protein n=1 Tax=Entomortierella parvispora TaxID=205924 RepID=A0A9P3LTP1_9FUNG|nr:hypothetical protein EMPS_02451 [Entomortierella parvispora]
MVRAQLSKNKSPPPKSPHWPTGSQGSSLKAPASNEPLPLTNSSSSRSSSEGPARPSPHPTKLPDDGGLTLATSVLVPRVLDHAPDPRLNLYVKGLPPNTTSTSLFDRFKPYGNILSCKVIVDYNTGLCKGGFVLFDSQESCIEARRDLTRQGLYVAVAHDSVSLKNLHYEESTPTEVKPLVPELDDSAAFPGLPSSKQNPKKSPTQIPSPIASAPAPPPPKSSIAAELRSKWDSPPLPESPEEHISTPTKKDGISSDDDDLVSDTSFTLGHSFLDFDSGFIGTHQKMLSDEYNMAGGFHRQPSFMDHKTAYSSVNDIDKYMNALELSNCASVAPQMSSNTEPSHHSGSSHAPHISSTMIDEFMSEERPSQRSSVKFEDFPDHVRYLDLFYLFAQYGPLVMSSVDIRDINELCPRMGVVSFESHRDAEFAVCSLSNEGYRVSHVESGTAYQSGPAIDDQLYHQYYQQHQEMMQLPRNGYVSPMDSVGQISSSTNVNAVTPPSPQEGDDDCPWDMPTSEPFAFSSITKGPPPGFEEGRVALSAAQEKLSMLGVSPMSVSLSPSSSIASYGAGTDEAADTTSHFPLPIIDRDSADATTEDAKSSETEISARTVKPGISYSAMLRVPAKPKSVVTDNEKHGVLGHPPSQDLKRRGNTNKSLDEKEYNLNLFLKDLEPTMNEFKLYDICVKFGPVMSCRTITTHHGVCTGLGFVMYIHKESVERAIQGMKELGYHAEVAIQSATNKLRCKVRSDTLFLQNIPPLIKEHKLRELFRPYHIEHCNVLRDPRTGKGKGVAFLKVKDMNVADRFIEEYHGRILGKDWKLPLQVSPAKEH